MDDSNRNKNIIKPCKNSIEKNNLWIITFKMGAKYIWFYVFVVVDMCSVIYLKSLEPEIRL